MTSDRFSKSLTPADGNNIVLLLDLNAELASYEQFKPENIVDHTIILEDFHAKVGLFSLIEADLPDSTALSSPAAQDAAYAKTLKDGQKIFLELYTARGNGPWEIQGEEVLQNKNGFEQPWALMAPFFSTNETALLGESLKIGVRVAPKAQGIGGLKGSDYLRIFGTWRKVTKIESKKNSLEALSAQVANLQIILEGMLANLPANTLLGRGSTSGVATPIAASQFASQAEVTDLANLKVNAASPVFTGIMNNGGGRIQFPPTQVTSSDPNCLDDYEEGTFTPVIIGLTSAGVGTYSTQSGDYTKIGRLVRVRILLNWSAHTGAGDMRVSGLPFLSASSGLEAVSMWSNSLSFSSGQMLQGYVFGTAGNVGQVVLAQIPTGGGAPLGIPMDTAGSLLINVSYSAVS